MRFLRLEGYNPYDNLALEEHVLFTRTQGDYLLLWQNARTIVVGRHQNTMAEIDASFVEAEGITVVRRMTGGGAVYHDLGNLNFSFITDAGSGRVSMERFTGPVVEALRQLGVPAQVSGRNDIIADGRKISGNAQTLHRGRILHHGTLLFQADLAVAGRALRVHPAKLASRGVQSVRSRVANISEFLPSPMTMEEFIAHMAAAFTRTGGGPVVLTPGDKREAARLSAEKYASWDWNYGRSPEWGVHVVKKYDGGLLEICARVEKGLIRECAFYGDFMALRPAGKVAEALRGCRFAPSAINDALASLPLDEYFGSISREEVLDCFLSAAPRHGEW